MSPSSVLIITDIDSMEYWNTLTEAAKHKAGSVRIERDQAIDPKGFPQKYDWIVLDVSDLKALYQLIPMLHEQQPTSRIIVLTSAPVWKLTREVFRLGAADLIRKPANPELVLEALSPQQR